MRLNTNQSLIRFSNNCQDWNMVSLKLQIADRLRLFFWEAITVGAAEAIKSGKTNLNLDDFYIWVADDEFNKLVTGATNSSPMLEKRIKYAKDKFCR